MRMGRCGEFHIFPLFHRGKARGLPSRPVATTLPRYPRVWRIRAANSKGKEGTWWPDLQAYRRNVRITGPGGAEIWHLGVPEVEAATHLRRMPWCGDQSGRDAVGFVALAQLYQLLHVAISLSFCGHGLRYQGRSCLMESISLFSFFISASASASASWLPAELGHVIPTPSGKSPSGCSSKANLSFYSAGGVCPSASVP